MITHVLRAAFIWLAIYVAAVLGCILVFVGVCWVSNSMPHGVHSATDWLRFVGDLFGAVWLIVALFLICAVIGACRSYRPAPPRPVAGGTPRRSDW
jgi:hypothetical protein